MPPCISAEAFACSGIHDHGSPPVSRANSDRLAIRTRTAVQRATRQPATPQKATRISLRHRHHLGRKVHIRWCCVDLMNAPNLSGVKSRLWYRSRQLDTKKRAKYEPKTVKWIYMLRKMSAGLPFEDRVAFHEAARKIYPAGARGTSCLQSHRSSRSVSGTLIYRSGMVRFGRSDRPLRFVAVLS